MSNFKELTKGIFRENPVLITLLGMCPTLAVTTAASNGLGMGAATTFVLLGSNIVISLLKNIIPKTVRLPAYIVIIAGFVTLIDLLMKGYLPELHSSLGLFLQLITVNCIILGRAEVFASKNNVKNSILDAIGMGIGFTIALFVMGSLREILGEGAWMGINLGIETPMTFFILPAGGFLILGVIIAVLNKALNKVPPKEFDCEHCPNSSVCTNKSELKSESEEE